MDKGTAVDLILCEVVRRRELPPWKQDLYLNSILPKVSEAVQLTYSKFYVPSITDGLAAYASVVLEGSIVHFTAMAASDADLVVRDPCEHGSAPSTDASWLLISPVAFAGAAKSIPVHTIFAHFVMPHLRHICAGDGTLAGEATRQLKVQLVEELQKQFVRYENEVKF